MARKTHHVVPNSEGGWGMLKVVVANVPLNIMSAKQMQLTMHVESVAIKSLN